MDYIGTKLDDKNYEKRKASFGLIFNKDGEMAIVYLEKCGIYNMIGGKIEENEVSKDALIRETMEETGYDLIDIEYYDNVKCYYEVSNQYCLGDIDFYIAKLGKKIANPTEIDHKLIWVKPEEMKDKMYFEYHRYILNKYLKENE